MSPSLTGFQGTILSPHGDNRTGDKKERGQNTAKPYPQGVSRPFTPNFYPTKEKERGQICSQGTKSKSLKSPWYKALRESVSNLSPQAVTITLDYIFILTTLIILFQGDKWGQKNKKTLYMDVLGCFDLSPYLFSQGTNGDKTS